MCFSRSFFSLYVLIVCAISHRVAGAGGRRGAAGGRGRRLDGDPTVTLWTVWTDRGRGNLKIFEIFV